MMLLVLDKNPRDAAMKVPNRLKHKQLLELMQMISCVVDFGYKQLPQGKELKKWIEGHTDWVYVYAKVLMEEEVENLKEETRIKYQALLSLLRLKCKHSIIPNLKTAVFRYVKEYTPNTIYISGSELPITEVVPEYQKYIEWKGDKWR